MNRALIQQAFLALTSAGNKECNFNAYKDVAEALFAELSKPKQQSTLFFGRAVYFADPKTGEIKNEVMECLQ